MLVAGLGAGAAETLSVRGALAEDGPETLSFGNMEPLVGLMQDMPPDALLPLLVERLRQGTDLRELVAAGALANARTFGGEDYIGFHSFMALAPSYYMSRELPADRRALPVLKVLYRSSAQIQAKGGRKSEVLQPMDGAGASLAASPQELRKAVLARDIQGAERHFAEIVRQSPKDGLEALQPLVDDELDVHRVVLAYRAWGMLDLAGREHAHTMLRQSVRYCVNVENMRARSKYPESPIRTILPRVLDRHKLLEAQPGSRRADDTWVERTAHAILNGTAEQAADLAAGALADGIDPTSIGEALTLAANMEVLRDGGRSERQAQPGKPAGSVHGDSLGVHASDAVNAWRNIASVSGPRNEIISLVTAASFVAQSSRFAARDPYPWPEHLAAVRPTDPAALLAEADAAIRAGDQVRACAVVQRYGELGHPAAPVFELMLRYATSEDGSLHAEKYYRTVREEFARTRRAFRWRQLVALARVTASEFGQPAPGYEAACRLLKVGDSRTVRA
ncbi:MAG: hypothetical protein K0Q72_4736 [Armatimonadetes bacterium]|nr:hypothetical protein [Armatimonadota bacterium]